MISLCYASRYNIVDAPVVIEDNDKPYDAFEHLCSVAFPYEARERIVAMITAYFDESGTHRNQNVAPPTLSLGCYISTEEQWGCFNREWQEVLNDAGVDHFHANKFENRKREYEEWTDEKRIRIYKRLQGIIKRRVKKGIAACIVLPDYDEVITGKYQEMFGSPYSVVTRVCFECIGEWSKKHNLQEPVACVFESGAGYNADIFQVFDRLKTDCNLGSLSFDDKRIMPLQAADILAYEVRKLAITVVGCLRDDERKLFMRRSMKNLFGYPHEDLYLDKVALMEVIADIESGGVLR